MGPHNSNNAEPFEFPPGHRKKIERFIVDLKKKYKPPSSSCPSKRKTFNSSKKPKRSKITTSSDAAPSESMAPINTPELEEHSTQANTKDITDDIRSRVIKWGQKKKLTLIENQHFTLLVKNDVSSQTVCASIRCGCGKKIHSQPKRRVLVDIKLD